MDYCIRCNPISELLTDGDGNKRCAFHGSNYLLESRPDPVEEAEPEPAPEVVAPVGEVIEPTDTTDTDA